MSYLVEIPALWVGLRRRKQQIKLFRWNSHCYGNIRHSIYPAAVFVYPKRSWKKNDPSSWDFPFLPSFQNTHIFHHLHQTQSSFFSSPKQRNCSYKIVLNNKICAQREGHFGYGGFDGSWSTYFFLCTYVSICLWHSEKHKFQEGIIHVLLVNYNSGV